MLDVSEICARNWERRREEERRAAMAAQKQKLERRAGIQSKLRTVLRVARLACAMATGAAACYVGAGFACGNAGIVTIGTAVAIGFLACIAAVSEAEERV